MSAAKETKTGLWWRRDHGSVRRWAWEKARRLVERIPGTAAHVAARKRRLERQLRAEGHSRIEARRLVSERFTRG